MNNEKLIESRKLEIENLYKALRFVEELNESVGLKQETFKDIQTKVSSRIAQCEISIRDNSKAQPAKEQVGEPCFTEEDLRFIDDEYETDLCYRCKYDDIKNHLNTRANEYRLDGMKKALAKAAENASIKSVAGRNDHGVLMDWKEVDKSSITDPKNLEV